MVAPLLLIFAATFYRVALVFGGGAEALGLLNFAPMGALALMGGVYLPRRTGLWLPLLALAASDAVLNGAYYHAPLLSWEMLPRYAALLATGFLGFFLRARPSLGRLLMGGMASSLLFFVVTNTASWWGEPLYSKTVAGWVQALTSGLPGYPSTLWFYKNTLLSDLAFTLFFAVCVRVSAPAAMAVGTPVNAASSGQ
jgi:hypothetical protein